MKRTILALMILAALLAATPAAWAQDGAMGQLPDISQPGRSIVTGTLAQVTGSLYLDVTVASTEVVRMAVDSVPRTVMLHLEPAGGAALAVITVSGLPAGAVFYLYRDGDPVPLELVTDEGGSCSFSQDIASPHALSLQPVRSTILLGDSGWSNSDGQDLNGVVGTWDPATRVAVLITDVNESINITAGNILLDGAGLSVSGSGSGSGIGVGGLAGVTVRNLKVRGFSNGIYSGGTLNMLAQGNDLSECGYGIYVYNSVNLNIRGNTFSACGEGVYFYGFEQKGVVVEGNTITGCGGAGVDIIAGREIKFLKNFISGCNDGLAFLFCYGNVMTGNVLVRNVRSGIQCDQVWNAVVSENVISGNGRGIYLYDYCFYNRIFRNNISRNGLGAGSSCRPIGQVNRLNVVYNNNFLFNTAQVDWKPSTWYPDTFYLPAPTGGNHWSDWTGPDQNGDGFVDVPYTVNSVLNDNLPLVNPVGITNHAPVLDPIGDKTVNEGELLQFTVTAFDPDGDLLAFSAANLPPGASFDPATATFSWTPGYDQAGVYEGVEFTVTDDGIPLELATELITITVGNVNRPPVFTPIGSQQVIEYHPLSFTVAAQDPDGDAVTLLQPAGLPRGASFDASTGAFNWTPDGNQQGVYIVTFLALDNGVPPQTGSLEVVITVGQISSPVELTGILIDTIVSLGLPLEVENSYLANLKKVVCFIEAGKVGAALNQVEAFVHKVGQDINQGMVPAATGDYLLMMGGDILALLSPAI